jgi:hypothetical protein
VPEVPEVANAVTPGLSEVTAPDVAQQDRA